MSLSAPSDLPTTVTYATADGTAIANTDYVPIAPTTLTFAPGQTQQTLAAVPCYLDLESEPGSVPDLHGQPP